MDASAPAFSDDREKMPLERQKWWQRAGVRPRDFLSWLVLAATCLVVIWSLSSSVWRNYQIRQEISQAQTELDRLKLEKERMQSLLVYYNSRSFQEIQLRQHFLLKKADETVVALRTGQPQEGVSTPEEMAPPTPETPPPTGWRLWWQFYFGSTPPLYQFTK